MPKIDIRMGEIYWPAKCCRCGGEQFTYRTRTEKIVTRSVLTVTEYRVITLADVPVCDRCEKARFSWFAGAVVAAAIGFYFLQSAGLSEMHAKGGLAMLALAGLLAGVGSKKKPIRIIKFHEKNNSFTIDIPNRDVAAEMMRREAVRTDLEGHAEYLAVQQEKQRTQDREVRMTVRALCLVGFALGLFFVIKLGETAGYGIMLFSVVCAIPFEMKHQRKK